MVILFLASTSVDWAPRLWEKGRATEWPRKMPSPFGPSLNTQPPMNGNRQSAAKRLFSWPRYRVISLPCRVFAQGVRFCWERKKGRRLLACLCCIFHLPIQFPIEFFCRRPAFLFWAYTQAPIARVARFVRLPHVGRCRLPLVQAGTAYTHQAIRAFSTSFS